MSSFEFVEKVMCIGSGNPSPILQFYKKGFRIGNGSVTPDWRDVVLSGNTALTLVNAKADSLEYLKLFGGTEQRNLPSGYTQVAYMRSSGTQWIDTGYYPNQNTKFKISGKQGDTDCALFGLSQVLYCFNNSGTTTYYGFCGDNSSFTFTMRSVPIVLTMSATDGIVINGTKYVDLTAGSTTADYPMALFGRMTNTTGEIAKLGNHRINYAKIYENNILIHNYIPCRRNSDNVLGMYDTVTGNFLTNAGTGTFTAGADVVPTPDNPIDIVCNNGVVKVNRNLYSTQYHDKTLSQTNGVTTNPSSGVNVSGKVDCRTIKSFKITTTLQQGSSRIFKYRADNTFIDATTTVSMGDIITLENNVGFFRIQYNYTSSSVNTEDILIYDSAHNLGIYTDGTAETVEITGKNLFDYEYFYDNYQMYSTSDVGRYPIKLKPNTTYTVSTNRNSSEDKSVVFVVSGSAIDWTPNTANNGVTSYSPRTVTTDSNGYLCLGIYVQGNREVPESEFINGTTWMQIEQSSTATTYEPYFNGGNATAEMLLKVGTYQDMQSVIDGGVTRNIRIKVLDGSEAWTKYSGNTWTFLTRLYDYNKEQSSCPVISTHFKKMNGWNGKNGIHIGNNVIDGIHIGADGYFSNVDDFKTWLANQYNAGQPVVILYPLATPTTETVTPQPMNIQAGTNNVTITQASMDGLELEVKYKAGVSVTITEIQNAQLDNNVEVTING